jgi:hypothetical protein
MTAETKCEVELSTLACQAQVVERVYIHAECSTRSISETMNIKSRFYTSLLLWSIATSSVHSQEFHYPTLITPKSCRPPLAIDWFINNAQTKPNFSRSVTDRLNDASKDFTAYLNSQLSGIEALSVVVAAPWGIVSEFNYGKLRMNDTKDTKNVSGDGLYRVASVSKVYIVSFKTYV